jgi:uncharacterized membrane protein YagU involved in acid resistance
MTANDGVIRSLFGLVSGVVATGPMTAAMIAMHRRLPPHERYALPPGEIVGQLSHATGARRAVSRDAEHAATILSHFGYGGAAGALYGAVDRIIPGNLLLKGAGFGLFVWTASYLGLLPAAGILQPASRHPERRTALMIAAHGVWGVTLAAFTSLFANEAHRLSPDRGPDVAR